MLLLALLLVGAVGCMPVQAADEQGRLTRLGVSTQGRAVEVARFGQGPRHVVLVGGIHGGYEWNTVLLAYAFVDYFAAHPQRIPPALTVHIVPVANPDGLARVVGQSGRFDPSMVQAESAPGRFNANQVDLNRNWACDWQPEARWRDETVSGGSAPFSEAESRLLRDLFMELRPAAVIFWHSAAPGVFPGGCAGRYAAADALGQRYAQASGYPFQDAFTAYPITGDATNWLAQQDIPAVTVELRTRNLLEWEENLAGVRAVLAWAAAPWEAKPTVTAPGQAPPLPAGPQLD